MQRKTSRNGKLSLGQVYSESFKSFLTNKSMIIFLIGIIIFSILYIPLQSSASLASLYLPKLSSINTTSTLNSSVLSSLFGTNLPGLSGMSSVLGPLVNVASTFISSGISFVLLFFAVAVLEVLIVRRVVAEKLEVPVKSYINLVALSIIVMLFIEMPLFLAFSYGISFGASINLPLGVIISALSMLFLIYVAVRLIFSQIYTIAKAADPISSIELSFNVTKKRFWFVFGTLLIPLILIAFVVSIIFGAIAFVAPSASAIINGISLSFIVIIIATILTKYLFNYLELQK
ncbi:hypothetical protein IG206_00530 [Candidatus Parvarchaeota archaeon]|nr:hypothetical protein [Candidatus Acidifodinimicrobium mancum]